MRKANGHEAKLAYLGDVSDGESPRLGGQASAVPWPRAPRERDAACRAGRGVAARRRTVGGDKGSINEFVDARLRHSGVTPHVAEKANGL